MDFGQLKKLVAESRNVVFFGGAGTSTESGIPDFRSADGLYRAADGGSFSPEEILSRDFFLAHPADFYTFYKGKMLYPDARPNAAHYALAEMEQRGQLAAVITQNIDGLHQKAGNRNVLELHGSVHRNFCMDCREAYSLQDVLKSKGDYPRCFRCGGIVKPDVVLYQESLDMDLLQRAADYIRRADVLIVAGTSLTVQPAAGLVRLYEGDKLVLINKSATPLDGTADYLISDSVAQVLAALSA